MLGYIPRNAGKKLEVARRSVPGRGSIPLAIGHRKCRDGAESEKEKDEGMEGDGPGKRRLRHFPFLNAVQPRCDGNGNQTGYILL